MAISNQKRTGQSVVEYLVLLALIFIIVVAVVHGVGQHTRTSVAQANEGLEEQKVAAGTSAKGQPSKPAAAGIAPAAVNPIDQE